MISILLRIVFIFLFIFSCQIRCPEFVGPYVPYKFEKAISVQHGYGYNFEAIDFPTNQIAYISGTRGSILKSTDGGASFTLINLLGPYILRDIAFVNEYVGVAAGDVKALFITYNGGANWVSIDVPDSINSIEHVYYASEKEIFLVGGLITTYGKIYYTKDRGLTWKNVFTPLGGYAYDMARLSNGKWIVSTGNAKIWYSLNKGSTWAESNIAWNGSDTTDILLADIQMVNNDLGYTCGINKSATESFVLKTLDGGLHWKKLDIPSTTNTEKDYFFSIYTLNDREVFVAGGQLFANTSRLIYSPDAGQTWKVDSSFLNDRYVKEIVINRGTMHGVGMNGLIFSK